MVQQHISIKPPKELVNCFCGGFQNMFYKLTCHLRHYRIEQDDFIKTQLSLPQKILNLPIAYILITLVQAQRLGYEKMQPKTEAGMRFTFEKASK